MHKRNLYCKKCFQSNPVTNVTKVTVSYVIQVLNDGRVHQKVDI